MSRRLVTEEPGRRSRQDPRRGSRRDAGQVAGIEAIPFGLLVFVAGVLLIANAWAVIDAKLAADAAAREAARSYVEGWPDSGASLAAARRAAFDAARSQGRDTAELRFDAPGLDPSYTRCARVTITTHDQVPAVSIPFIGGFGHGFTVTSHHTEVIDPFRNGGGTANACP